MLTNCEAFKFGFLARCTEEGLSLPQAHGLVKQALFGLDKLPGMAVDTTKDVAGTGLAWGIPLALGAPLAAGAAGGYGLAKVMDISDRDKDEVKGDELTDEYRRNAELLRHIKAVRDSRRARLRPSRSLLG